MKTKIITVIAAFATSLGAMAIMNSQQIRSFVKQSAVAPQSRPAEVHVGDVISAQHLHLITNPGMYGLGSGLPGSSYAITDGHLVRVDRDSNEVLSIIRAVNGILD